MDNREQHKFWNGMAGEQWAEQDALMSTLLSPISALLRESALLAPAKRVLNVGCGGGSDTFHLLEALADDAIVNGVDISAPLLAVAQRRLEASPELAKRVSYRLADAGKDDLGAADHDLVFSRFGVMFFAEPVVAFEHIRAHCVPGASLLFACWQSPGVNDWIKVPMGGALSVVDAPAPSPPRSPGPFAFAEPEYVRALLEQAGWTRVSVEPREVVLRWGDSGDLASSAKDLLRTGPVGRLLIDVDDETRQRVYEAVASALAPYSTERGIELGGAIWVVSASNG